MPHAGNVRRVKFQAMLRLQAMCVPHSAGFTLELVLPHSHSAHSTRADWIVCGHTPIPTPTALTSMRGRHLPSFKCKRRGAHSSHPVASGVAGCPSPTSIFSLPHIPYLHTYHTSTHTIPQLLSLQTAQAAAPLLPPATSARAPRPWRRPQAAPPPLAPPPPATSARAPRQR
eukprot:349740-Chlamydomonas_euryale.AAC.1